MGVLRSACPVLWVLAVCWLPLILAGELARPRIGGNRWATVFPIGMYAAMSFTVASVAGLPTLVGLADADSVVAAAVWLLVLAYGIASSRAA